MNEQKIEEIKNALREILRLLISRNQPLTEEIKGGLVQVIQYATSRIQELRQQEVQAPVEELAPTPMKEPALNQQMESSNVYAFGYDPERQRLLVKFQGNDGIGAGPVYGYDGVPQSIFDIFQKGAIPARTDGQNKWGKWWKGKVPSLGASLYTLIKNGPYPYQRLS